MLQSLLNDHANQFRCTAYRPSHFTAARAQQDICNRLFDVDSETSTYLPLPAGRKLTPRSQARKTDYAFGILLTFRHRPPSYPTIRKRIRAATTADRTLLPSRPSHWPGPAALAACRGGQRRLSHFPGTDRHANPATKFDLKPMRELGTEFRWLLSLDDRMLEATGNIELRCWAVAASGSVPDMVSFDPSWHHNYATFAWWSSRTGIPIPCTILPSPRSA